MNREAFDVWRNMIRRCENSRGRDKEKQYADCTVADEWLNFDNFQEFWDENHKPKYQLDKDLLFYGNKTYSPDRCVFVPQEINNFPISHRPRRGPYPQGVSWSDYAGKYQSKISINGKRIHLGYFSSARDAHRAWHQRKLQQAEELKALCDSIHPRLFAGLMSNIRNQRTC